jgi:hypothetical protein
MRNQFLDCIRSFARPAAATASLLNQAAANKPVTCGNDNVVRSKLRKETSGQSGAIASGTERGTSLIRYDISLKTAQIAHLAGLFHALDRSVEAELYLC